MLCVDKHPTQPHLIVTGGQDGVLGLWDMRQEKYPVTLLEAHSAESTWKVLSIQFMNLLKWEKLSN